MPMTHHKEKMREERRGGVESKRRNTSVEENRRIFKEMIEGKSEGYGLRAKIDMSNCNRDDFSRLNFENTC